MYHLKKQTSGFSLLELAIVVVIIGLIAGGIAVGDSLITSSKLQAIAEEKSQLASATKLFQDKYYSIPGDYKLAESIWGKLSGSNCNNFNSSGLTGGTCNGDGNGKVTGNEVWGFWHHIALAGFMPLTYSGVHTGGSSTFVSGANIPNAKWSEAAGWYATYVGPKSSDSTYYDGSYGHAFILGDVSTGSTSNGVMEPKDQESLDIKFDDGKPDDGNIRAAKATFVSGCVSGTDYVEDGSAGSCAPIWITGF